MSNLVCIRDHFKQILSGAITYEGVYEKYKDDPRVIPNGLSDTVYDILVSNLKIYQKQEPEMYQEVLKDYPEFLDEDWKYTGSFFYSK